VGPKPGAWGPVTSQKNGKRGKRSHLTKKGRVPFIVEKGGGEPFWRADLKDFTLRK